jgi:hypothetical protein
VEAEKSIVRRYVCDSSERRRYVTPYTDGLVMSGAGAPTGRPKRRTVWNKPLTPLSQNRSADPIPHRHGESENHWRRQVDDRIFASSCGGIISDWKSCCFAVPAVSKKQCILVLGPPAVSPTQKKACNAGSECGATAFHTSATAVPAPGNTFGQGERYEKSTFVRHCGRHDGCWRSSSCSRRMVRYWQDRRSRRWDPGY